MNPKQKADELIEKFKPMCNGTLPESIEFNAIECAIIAVEEIINLGVCWYDENCMCEGEIVIPEQTFEFWEEILTILKSRQ